MINLTIYGDSISTDTHGEGGYAKRLLKSGIFYEIKSFAISGSGLSSSTPNNLYSIIIEKSIIPHNSDWIIIWHGTNDWFYGSKIDLFESQFFEIIDRLKNALPKTQILCLLPIYRYETPEGCPYPGNAFITKNKIGLTLSDYRASLLKIIQLRELAYIDMTASTKLFQEDISRYYEDQVHPNKFGMDIISEIIASFFKSII